MHSTSQEYKNMSAKKGVRLVPMEIPIVCWKTRLPFKDNVNEEL
jgi:hypothetical protein